MGISPHLKTYRVVGVREDDTREVIHTNLSQDVAEAIRRVLNGIFRKILIEAEESAGDP